MNFQLFKSVPYILVGVLIGSMAMMFQWTDNVISVKVSFLDLATIALTVATIVLGAVALIVAFISIFGFKVILNEAVKKAEKVADEKVDSSLEKRLGIEIKKELAKMLEEGTAIENIVLRANMRSKPPLDNSDEYER